MEFYQSRIRSITSYVCWKCKSGILLRVVKLELRRILSLQFGGEVQVIVTWTGVGAKLCAS